MAENNCSIALAGIAQDCQPNNGGVKRVLIAPASDVEARTAEMDKIGTITMKDMAKFKEYHFKVGMASLTSTLTREVSNGTLFYTSVLTMQFNRMETAKRKEIMALSQDDLIVIVEDMNGAYWYLGYDEPVCATGGESGTGQARTDANKYGIVLTDNSNSLPLEVDSSIIAGIVSAL